MSVNMARAVVKTGSASFVADPHSLDRNDGRQVDWANVSATNADGHKYIPAGTVVGDLLGTGKISPRVVTTNPAIGILEAEAIEGDTTAALSGYGVLVGGVFFENLLPDATGGPPKTLATAIKTELGSAGTGFAFIVHEDSRGS